ncbi:hypothetical protein OROHE_005847 [Orobanche hederae]
MKKWKGLGTVWAAATRSAVGQIISGNFVWMDELHIYEGVDNERPGDTFFRASGICSNGRHDRMSVEDDKLVIQVAHVTDELVIQVVVINVSHFLSNSSGVSES